MRTNTMELLHYDTYRAMIANSVGSRQYRNNWALVDGERRDITKDGLISCAFYVSAVLRHFNLLETPHATVSGTVRDLERSGWRLVQSGELVPGDLVVWEKAGEGDGEEHLHIGFYVDAQHAVSHSDKERTPVLHELAFNHRKIIAAYTHDFMHR